MISEVAFDIAWAYNITCTNITPLSFGRTNNVYKAVIENGDNIVIKEYLPTAYDKKKLVSVEKSLMLQNALSSRGFRCPKVFITKNGTALRHINDYAYSATTNENGLTVDANTITASMMRSLGEVCAEMHYTFRKIFVDIPSHFHDVRCCQNTDILPDTESEFADSVNRILSDSNINFFEKSPQGIVHRSFSADNILFDENGVSAVLDFECCGYGCLYEDIGRAILSFCWHNGNLDLEKVRAFIQGYNKHIHLEKNDIADALRVIWYIEAPRILKTKSTSECKQEIIWLTKEWENIDKIMQKI